MSIFQKQLEREAGWDVRVAIVGGIIFFGCMILLPRSWFWFYFVPIAGFWYRYIFVRDRRDEALLAALEGTEVGSGVGLVGGGQGAAGCYRSEAGICIFDGTHHVLVARDQPDALLQLPHIRGRQ